MGGVISFQQAKEERTPHFAGEGYCTACKHTWAAVAPVGADRLECPKCELPRGLWKHPFGAAVGDLLFTCICGCEALTAYQRKGRFYLRCMGCGADQTAAIYGEAP